VQALVAQFARTEAVGQLTLKGFHRPVLAFAVQGRIEASERIAS
jgi:class 3 adenylate cyclase